MENSGIEPILNVSYSVNVCKTQMEMVLDYFKQHSLGFETNQK